MVSGAQQVVIVGPLGGRDLPSTQQAVINTVTVTGGATVTLEEVAINDNAGNPAAVQCNGQSRLNILNSFVGKVPVTGNGGVYSIGCSVDIEKTKIYSTLGYGISISQGSGHRIVNNAIMKNGLNGTEANAMKLTGIINGLFAYNNFAGNNQGITCDTQIAVTDSIVWDTMSGPALAGSCQQSNIVTNANANGAVLDPTYTTGADPALTDPNDTCVDKGAADVTILDDYYSHPRAQGKGYDIGFQELR
jgi:hypothetical protein